MFNGIKRLLTPAEIQVRRSEQLNGIGADSLLRTLGPVVDRRIEELILKLIACPPELELFLDLRAQLSEVHRIQHELKAVKELGKEAGEALSEVFMPTSR